MAMIRWNPWSDLFSLHDQMDQLFNQAFGDGVSTSQRGVVATLPVDIRQTDEAYFIEASVPGFKPEDVEVTLDQGILTIQATARHEHDDRQKGYVRRERATSSLYRQVSLPSEVLADKVSASFEHGVLTIRVPRAEKAQPRRIEVTTGGTQANVIDAPKATEEHQPAATSAN